MKNIDKEKLIEKYIATKHETANEQLAKMTDEEKEVIIEYRERVRINLSTPSMAEISSPDV